MTATTANSGDNTAPGDPPRPAQEFAIRIGRDGTWFYHDSPIARKPLVRLFASALCRADDGSYWLVTPFERGRITVDDAPFAAVEVEASGAGTEQALRFRTNVDDEVTAGRPNPIRVAHHPDTGEPSPYILVRDRMEARLLRPVYYRLVELAVERRVAAEDVLGVWSKGVFFPLGRLG